MMKTYETPLGDYRTGLYAANAERWYGKMNGAGMTMVSREEFLAAISENKPPPLDPLPF